MREVIDGAAHGQLVESIVGHLLNDVSESVLQRAFGCWGNVDNALGGRVERGVRTGQV
ncbi:hypothetical protein ACWCQN_43820 [Streptomyces sp. NPDC001984]|uniref:hypothetical protein n=1 Tax=Streptomyces sp. NPDC002619 TaxID=3364655 RepID=UPI00369AF58D